MLSSSWRRTSVWSKNDATVTSLQRSSCIILRSLNIESEGNQPDTSDRKTVREIDEFYVFLQAKTIDDQTIVSRTMN